MSGWKAVSSYLFYTDKIYSLPSFLPGKVWHIISFTLARPVVFFPADSPWQGVSYFLLHHDKMSFHLLHPGKLSYHLFQLGKVFRLNINPFNLKSSVIASS